jgi:alpha-1,6-mannosyltransferase
MHHLGAGYAAHGHEVVLVVPGPAHADNTMPSGVRRITLLGVRIPRSGGYHVVGLRQALELLQRLRPDRIEVSDRLTLRGLGRWAATCGVPSVMIAHERLDRLLHQFLLPDPAARWLADRANRHTACGVPKFIVVNVICGFGDPECAWHDHRLCCSDCCISSRSENR